MLCTPIAAAPATEYVVQTSASANKASWKWRHRRQNVAVLAIVPGATPKMISWRARGVQAIMSYEGGCFVGRSKRDQFTRALRRAEAMAAELNAQAQRACAPALGGVSCG